MTVDVVLVTCRELAGSPDPDDAALRDLLTARGRSVAIVPWDEPAFDWSSARLALLRSTWDYFHRRDEFLAWAERVATVTALHNPPAVIRWNTHKGYLVELAAKGLPVVATELVKQGSRTDLDRLMNGRQWKKVVIKPAVSAGSFKTMLAGAPNMAEARAHLASIVEKGDALVQPYMANVEGYGERSLIMIDGVFTHAVRKRPAFGAAGAGVAEAFVPGEPLLENADVDPAVAAEDEAEAAQRIVEGAGLGNTLYARVDLIRELDGTPVLMELELVEPSLFLHHAGDKGRAVIADAVVKRIPA
jgi:hypothetical protein